MTKTDKYMTIITTILVATQVIRVTQNAISLHRQEKTLKRFVDGLKTMMFLKRISTHREKFFICSTTGLVVTERRNNFGKCWRQIHR